MNTQTRANKSRLKRIISDGRVTHSDLLPVQAKWGPSTFAPLATCMPAGCSDIAGLEPGATRFTAISARAQI